MSPTSVLFAARIWAAMTLALYVAFWLQVDGAASAATCVAILALQARGQAFQKALHRVFGTVIGITASMALTSLSPTPLLMISALNDTVTMTDLALSAYARALEPKRLVTIPGGHVDAYTSQFQASSAAALAWFSEHLA